MDKLATFIINSAVKLGFDLVGITPLAPSKYAQQVKEWVKQGKYGQMEWYVKNLSRRLQPTQHLWGKAKTAVVLGFNYRPQPLPSELRRDPSLGLIAYYAHYDDYHDFLLKLLRQLAEQIAKEINNKWQYRLYVDTGPVLEREIAMQAGLGFIGKNTTLINPQLGSFFWLSEIICDLDLPPKVYSPQSGQGGCGLCQRCLVACPTGALTAPYQLDARLCISYLTIEHRGAIPEKLRPLLENWVFGCDICQLVCPWNKRVEEAKLSKLVAKPELAAPHLLELASLTPDDFRERFRSTPVWRAKYSGFMRNVMIALGNWGVREAAGAVKKFLSSDDELIREHARWAWQQIKK